MITTGCRSRAWWRTKRNPDITVSDEPRTTNTSACSTRAYAASTRAFGTDSPKKTTSGLADRRIADNRPSETAASPGQPRHRRAGARHAQAPVARRAADLHRPTDPAVRSEPSDLR